MAVFHPKEVFQKAREAEQKGKAGDAATHYASLSVYLRRRGKKDEALTLIRRAITLAPSHARLHLQLALCAEAKQDQPLADLAMVQFTSLAIEQQKVDEYRRMVESQLKDHPRLRQIFFDRVLELDRTGAVAFLGRAKSLREQGDDEAAMKVILEALQTGDKKEEVLAVLEEILRSHAKAEALIHLGRYREGKISTENFIVLLTGAARGDVSAQRDFEPSARERPLRDLIDELEKEIGFELGNPQEEIAPVLQEFRRRSRPILMNDARARIDMGLAYFEMGLMREASEELMSIEEADPLFPEAQTLQGEVCLAQGSELAALDAFQKSLRAPTKTPEVEREARYKLVQVFYRLGDLRQAFSQAAELEKLDPNYRDLRLIKNQIQEALEKNQGGSIPL